jgi:hypothetical protein
MEEITAPCTTASRQILGNFGRLHAMRVVDRDRLEQTSREPARLLSEE